MSSGSTFTILQKRADYELASSKMLQDATEGYRKDIESGGPYKDKKLPSLVSWKDKFIETDTKILWQEVAETTFISDFTVLKDEWHMNPYDWDLNRHVVSPEEAFQLNQAAQYIIDREWSPKVEDLLGNPFISVFREEGYFIQNLKKADVMETGMLYDIKRLKEVTGAYLYLIHSDTCDPYRQDKSEFKLVYTAW